MAKRPKLDGKGDKLKLYMTPCVRFNQAFPLAAGRYF